MINHKLPFKQRLVHMYSKNSIWLLAYPLDDSQPLDILEGSEDD